MPRLICGSSNPIFYGTSFGKIWLIDPDYAVILQIADPASLTVLNSE